MLDTAYIMKFQNDGGPPFLAERQNYFSSTLLLVSHQSCQIMYSFGLFLAVNALTILSLDYY